ncbi:hypothetical protein [Chelativorans sp. AA-79]|uniref:hypothetical protein n=1 Tax=Chelativorans sp. AA-79 TaxID=3028735 RepID=UPI0023FA408C|nr:hypothetical protein [Chelativorans sp. AA-79]WEX07521.1 hypothetical protein PVE73_15505 [Chelativorans sp. AA-79]
MSQFEKPITIRYRAADVSPPVAEGEMETFIVAVRSLREGGTVCFAADYLNRFPLWCSPPSVPGIADRLHPRVYIEDCHATGWFDHIPDEANGAIISPMLLASDQQLVGWCPVDEMAP